MDAVRDEGRMRVLNPPLACPLPIETAKGSRNFDLRIHHMKLFNSALCSPGFDRRASNPSQAKTPRFGRAEPFLVVVSSSAAWQ